MKTCPRCHRSEPEVEFGLARSRYDGKQPYCRACWTLYVQQTRWAKGTKQREPLLERLWNNIQVCAHGIACPFCCWPWLKGCDQDGYGKFATVNAAQEHLTHPVTRILYEIWHARPIPNGLYVLHYCDVPPCCQPMHLWLGTSIQNRADCVQKGRQARGQSHGSMTRPEAFPRGEDKPAAKLTKAQVLEIRALYAPHTRGRTLEALAQMFHVSDFTISCIVHHKTWKHI
jgi:hypothetical protein